jgi:hypothetical protein
VDEKGEPLYLHANVLLRDSPGEFDRVATVALNRYRAEIEYLGSQLGRLVGTLKASGLYDSTLIVFLADHGEDFRDHSPDMAFAHAGLYRDASQIPFIVKLPDNRNAGTTRDDLVANIDVLPTVAHVVGATARAEWQGHDVFGEASPRDHLITAAWEHTDGMAFYVAFESETADKSSNPVPLFEEFRSPETLGEPRWVEHEIALPSKADEPFHLILETDPGPSGSAHSDHGAWANAHVECPRPGPRLTKLSQSHIVLIPLDTPRADHLGRLFERLRELGLYDDALIVVTSDHGKSLYDREFPGSDARSSGEDCGVEARR